jgi:transcriptional regulator with XRE-family HTH domain
VIKKTTSRKISERQAQVAAFAGALYKVRIEKDLSQEELAFRRERDRSDLSQLELGEKAPCLGIIFPLCSALDTVPSELFKRVEELYAIGHRVGKNPRVR